MVRWSSTIKHLTLLAGLVFGRAQDDDYNADGCQRTSTENCDELFERCDVEVDACREDAACEECFVRVFDRYDVCIVDIDFSTLSCLDDQVQDFTCCSFEGGDSCESNSLLRAYYGKCKASVDQGKAASGTYILGA